MKFVIVGRCATGKSTLAQALSENGLNVLQTMTTRDPRPNDPTDGLIHKFISANEAVAMDPTRKILQTTVGAYEYFTTEADLKAADVLIIEPEGVNELAAHMPGESIRLIHCVCDDEDARKRGALERSEDPAQAAVEFTARLQAEDERFTKFEDALTHNETFGFSSLLTYTYKNNYSPECLKDMTATILAHARKCENLKTIARQCIALGVLTSSEPDCVDVVYEHPTPYTMALPLEQYVDTLFYSDQNMAAMIHAWLSHNITIAEPEELVIEAMNQDADQLCLFTDDEEDALAQQAEDAQAARAAKKAAAKA